VHNNRHTYEQFLQLTVGFWSTICKTVCSVLSDRCPGLSVCDIGILWPNSWMDQNETWRGGRPQRRPHCVRWGPSSPPPKVAQPCNFGPCLLWPNGWMDQDATWLLTSFKLVFPKIKNLYLDVHRHVISPHHNLCCLLNRLKLLKFLEFVTVIFSAVTHVEHILSVANQ